LDSACNNQLVRGENGVSRRLLRNLPNAISIARLGTGAVLFGFVMLHRVEIFKWVLLCSLLSDIADGLIARAFHLTTKLGAFLDSVADVVTMLVAVLGVFVFQRSFVAEHYPGILLIVGFYLVEVLASLWRYGRVSSFHTVLARVAAFMAGVLVMWLFLFGYPGWLFQRTVLVYLVALSEEMLLIYLLPEWQSDVGGVYQLLLNRTGHGKQEIGSVEL
jgi:CDP-diacylglycerol--glycerol-3-phosphate 3-phosphatidyltransferase